MSKNSNMNPSFNYNNNLLGNNNNDNNDNNNNNRNKNQNNDKTGNNVPNLNNLNNLYFRNYSNLGNFPKNNKNFKLINPLKREINSSLRNIDLSSMDDLTSFDRNLLKIKGFKNNLKTRIAPIYHSRSQTNANSQNNLKLIQKVRKRNRLNLTKLIEANNLMSSFTFLKILFVKRQELSQKKIPKIKINNDSNKIKSKDIILPTLHSLNKTSKSIFDLN